MMKLDGFHMDFWSKRMRQVIPYILLFLLAGCFTSEVVQQNYYLLEYFQHTEKDLLQLSSPLDSVIVVSDTEIPSAFDRKQILIRHSGSRFSYSQNDRWGVRLSDAIPDLLSRRIVRYGIFSLTLQRPDKSASYKITSKLHALEMFNLETETDAQASLKMEFMLKPVWEEGILVRHFFNREILLSTDSVEDFVQAVNVMLLQEMDIFLAKVISFHRKDNSLVEQVTSELKADGRNVTIDPTIARSAVQKGTMPGQGKINGTLQVKDILGLGEDTGLHFEVLDTDGFYVDQGTIGKKITLSPGKYQVKLGSGIGDQRITVRDVQIYPKFNQVIEPEWGYLIVTVIDENRDYKSLRYEVFDPDPTGFGSFGTAQSSLQEMAEEERVWVLRPGLYKITINNEPVNTYRDFATIRVRKGELSRLTIVVDTDEDGNPTHMIGAGNIESSELTKQFENWKIFSAIHGNVNLTSDNTRDEKQHDTRFSLDAQFDNRVIYDLYPFHYTGKHLMELGVLKEQDIDLRVNTDEFSLKNTFVYYILERIGFYVRGDITSHLFEQYVYTSDPTNYIFNHEDGESETIVNVEDVRIRPSLFPIGLKEGIGINWRALESQDSNLNARIGFGLRQDLNEDVYVFQETSSIEGESYEVYQEVESSDQTGLEISVVSNFNLLKNVSLNSNLDVLFPFESGEKYVYEWENTFNIKLIRNLSIDYRLNLEFNEQERDYTVLSQSVYLRFTYFLY